MFLSPPPTKCPVSGAKTDHKACSGAQAVPQTARWFHQRRPGSETSPTHRVIPKLPFPSFSPGNNLTKMEGGQKGQQERNSAADFPARRRPNPQAQQPKRFLLFGSLMETPQEAPVSSPFAALPHSHSHPPKRGVGRHGKRGIMAGGCKGWSGPRALVSERPRAAESEPIDGSPGSADRRSLCRAPSSLSFSLSILSRFSCLFGANVIPQFIADDAVPGSTNSSLAAWSPSQLGEGNKPMRLIVRDDVVTVSFFFQVLNGIT